MNINVALFSYTRAFGDVILNHGQVTCTTPELAPPILTTTPDQREDASALDRFSVHRCPTRRVFSGIGLELVTKPDTIRYLYHLATAATKQSDKQSIIYRRKKPD
ncbi:uncharacterized protein TNCV_914751 [Trichonephila clavipes]|uniref:Uncharacterized protein n=1 Tax=Trichonephila clavipes TaxID=2585209 RepID=A0A8X6RM43_TRICX|nr:uncharacterized protein TNCV_914751 [Trichonephila clavipes]